MNAHNNESRARPGRTMDISKKAARALVTKGINATKNGDFEEASRKLKILNSHGAWWSARQLGAFINRQIESDERTLSTYEGGLTA